MWEVKIAFDLLAVHGVINATLLPGSTLTATHLKTHLAENTEL